MNGDQQVVPVITPAQLKQWIDTGEPLTLVDVRELQEWNVSNLGPFGARLIPLAELPARLNEIEREAPIVVYCRSGARSDQAVRFMIARGFEDVRNLAGGINEWAREVDPEMTVY